MSSRNPLRPLHKLLQPAVLLPLILTAALLTLAFKLGDLGRVLFRVQSMPIWVMIFALAMVISYLVLKAWQLHLLLANLGVRPDWKRFLLAFAVGELAVTLPFGIFSQNWVLSVTGDTHFGRSSAATVVMLLTETAVVLLFLAVVGIPRWPELRPIAGAFLIGLGLLIFAVLRFEHLAVRLAHKIGQPWVHRTLIESIGLIRGLRQLSNARALGINMVLAALYLGALAFAFQAVGNSIEVSHLNYLTAASIYAFSLAVVLLFGGLISQIGTVEILGMTAAQAWGINFTDGLTLMLGFRLVWTGAMWLLNLPIVALLWRSMRSRAETDGAAEASTDDLEEMPR